jgi:hypothetical protein
MNRRLIVVLFAACLLSCQRNGYTSSDDLYDDSSRDAKATYKVSYNDPYFNGTPVNVYVMGGADLLEFSHKKSKALVKLNPGEEITIIGRATDGYYKVKRGEYTGYIFQSYITKSAPFSSHSNPTGETHDMSPKTIRTGPKGGRYYINKNGNKVYVKKK